MSDGVVTWADVARWLPTAVRDDLLMALPPEARGWWTEAEAEADGGRFVEVTNMADATPRFLRTGGVHRLPFLPSIANVAAPTAAELKGRTA